MSAKRKAIPVNHFGGGDDFSISVERIEFESLPKLVSAKQMHRHNCHTFFLLEEGTVQMEIDFKNYQIEPCSIIYVHPDQVHRTITDCRIVVYSWAISDEYLNPEYLKILKEIGSAKPVVLDQATFVLFRDAVLLCLKIEENRDNRLYRSVIKDSCNLLVALTTAQYLKSTQASAKPDRFDQITKDFRILVDKNFVVHKRPRNYADMLNISTSYLNECVTNITGHSVSWHIQERVCLEAKRLLAYSNLSVKEISGQLGFEDYPYFSRVFQKNAGVSAIVFRMKNRD